MSYIFNNRTQAGRELARNLAAWAGRDDAIVLALPRGGVPVGFEVARALCLPLDVLVVSKLGAPCQPDVAVGAVARGGVIILDEPLLERLGIPTHEIIDEASAELLGLERRERAYRGNAITPDLEAKLVILVDDGMATGSTMKAAVEAVRRLGAEHVVVAVPTAPAATCSEIRNVADDVVCLHAPDICDAVAECYKDFSLLSDGQVRELLTQAHSLVC